MDHLMNDKISDIINKGGNILDAVEPKQLIRYRNLWSMNESDP